MELIAHDGSLCFGLQTFEYPEGWYVGARLPYIAIYWEFYDGAPELKVYFDGDDYTGVSAHSRARVESGADGWAYTGWYITTGTIPNDFEVNLIQTLEINMWNEEKTIHCISQMRLNDETEEGCKLLLQINTKWVTSGPAVMVAANQPGYEHTFGAYYSFEADVITLRCRWRP